MLAYNIILEMIIYLDLRLTNLHPDSISEYFYNKCVWTLILCQNYRLNANKMFFENNQSHFNLRLENLSVNSIALDAISCHTAQATDKNLLLDRKFTYLKSMF